MYLLSDGRRVNRLAGSVLSCSMFWVSVQTSNFTDAGLSSTYDICCYCDRRIYSLLDFDHGYVMICYSVVLAWF